MRKKKILIVDDKKENLVALEQMLKDFNVDIVKAISGDEGLKKTLNNEFAVAIVDIQMPGMDGFEMVDIMRQSRETKYLPVIFVSAVYNEDYYQLKGMKTGAVDFIPKPIIPDYLRNKIKVYLDLQDQKDQLKKLLIEQEETNKKLKKEILSRKMAEEKLKDAKQKAEKTSDLKTEFLANMSHEIRTPMNAIIGFTELITDPSLSNQTREKYIEYINNSGKNLLFLIDDIIDITKIEANQLKIIKTECNITQILSELYYAYEEIKIRKGKFDIELVLNPTNKRKHLTILNDPYRIRQVLANLIGNALKFTTEGSIEFGYLQKESVLEFYVKDTGIGIPENKIPLIFKRFGKLDNKKAINLGGTGLGLAISKSIVELLGGEIWLESEQNKGTQFYFTIPYKEIKIKKEKTIDTVLKPQDRNWDPFTILVAEDEEMNFLFLREVLNKTNAKLIWVKNGKEAVEKCMENEDIDLVLMDVKMPVMDGHDATREIKKFNPNLPIIAQTAFAMSGEEEKSMEAGCDGYITKPINRKDLFKLLEKYLNKNADK